ncbi:MAG: hypothetical protein M1827_002649 [Pycnora praestabilis]|nr:MAG: hypothetical protein M1827_002649 [Pycnora praestabilis]
MSSWMCPEFDARASAPTYNSFDPNIRDEECFLNEMRSGSKSTCSRCDIAGPNASAFDFTKEDGISSKRSKFRFKSSKEKPPKERHSKHWLESDPNKYTNDPSRARIFKDRHHHAHHQSKRRKHSHDRHHNPDDEAFHNERDSFYDDYKRYHDPPPSNHHTSDDAFRESLFDAMADDEGAEFWQGVYGQPIHTYPDKRPGPEGKLEQMTEDEYVAYVRAKMYEKTHEHVMNEKQKREELKARQKAWHAQQRAKEGEREEFQKQIEKSRKERQERALNSSWRGAWSCYLEQWRLFRHRVSCLNPDLPLEKRSKATVKDLIWWPVFSGNQEDVSKENVEQFFKRGPQCYENRNTSSVSEMQATFKAERVRWHPDKVQQMMGSHRPDEATTKAITAVFQIIDELWNHYQNAPS